MNYRVSVLLLGALLQGCVAPPGSPSLAPVVAVQSPPVGAPLAEPRVPAHGLSPAQIQRLLWLLDRADLALQERHFTTPDDNNAWAYYSEALSLIPNHPEARAGLRKIADSYVEWGYAALRQEQLESARSYLSRALMVDPDHAGAGQLRAAIPKRVVTAPSKPTALAKAPLAVVPRPAAAVAAPVIAPSPVATSRPPVAVAAPVIAPSPVATSRPPVAAVEPVVDAAQSEFPLERAALKARSRALQAQLAGYADLIEARNSRVTIQAPSDADGRWLYQRLNERREEYRIRANFRVSKQPKITLLD